jgi:hypothetical protein
MLGYLQVGKAYATKASRAGTVEEANLAQEEGVDMLKVVLIERGKGIIYEARQLASTMRRFPQIDVLVPTVRLEPCSFNCRYC